MTSPEASSHLPILDLTCIECGFGGQEVFSLTPHPESAFTVPKCPNCACSSWKAFAATGEKRRVEIRYPVLEGHRVLAEQDDYGFPRVTIRNRAGDQERIISGNPLSQSELTFGKSTIRKLFEEVSVNGVVAPGEKIRKGELVKYDPRDGIQPSYRAPHYIRKILEGDWGPPLDIKPPPPPGAPVVTETEAAESGATLEGHCTVGCGRTVRYAVPPKRKGERVRFSMPRGRCQGGQHEHRWRVAIVTKGGAMPVFDDLTLADHQAGVFGGKIFTLRWPSSWEEEVLTQQMLYAVLADEEQRIKHNCYDRDACDAACPAHEVWKRKLEARSALKKLSAPVVAGEPVYGPTGIVGRTVPAEQTGRKVDVTIIDDPWKKAATDDQVDACFYAMNALYGKHASSVKLDEMVKADLLRMYSHFGLDPMKLSREKEISATAFASLYTALQMGTVSMETVEKIMKNEDSKKVLEMWTPAELEAFQTRFVHFLNAEAKKGETLSDRSFALFLAGEVELKLKDFRARSKCQTISCSGCGRSDVYPLGTIDPRESICTHNFRFAPERGRSGKYVCCTCPLEIDAEVVSRRYSADRNSLADAAQAVRDENTVLMVENAALRRELESLKRRAGKK